MHTKNNALISIGMLLASSSFAGTMGAVPAGAYVATVSLAAAWVDPGETQTLTLQPDIVKTYSDTTNSKVVPAIELFLGWQHPINDTLRGQIGIAGAATTQVKLEGDVWEDADPAFNNFTYQYKVNHYHLAVKGKLLMDLDEWVEPYVSASAGIGFNQARDFQIAARIFQEIPAPPFNSETKSSFVYTLGIGLQTALNSNWQVGLGYEFADWGKTELSRASGQTVGNGIETDNFYAHQLQLSLSYIC
ncbi:hypothetical protein B1207_09735 [Legionella quinlivanii]|uniref:Outer membrane protein beta-barrel domain-containing protein n=1 Tax=Legionella quinlivanii TaxID=45073 RepID=A0A364LIZ2_9GAMM|nr:outer membrane beta-barrel protein [Legionella quinlivanii]RAP36408.1 hypothetical protein B1207_09735 [Legionella quinlivanii]